jgi:hypothetical protein
MITSKVRQRIQELSNEYYARIQVIETKAHQFLEYSQGGSHITFTPHGLSHISTVERNYDWLIPDSDLRKFNASELFCLICATFFHDALMIPKRLGDETSARENHIQRAHDFLLRHRDLLGLSIHEGDAISQVIRGHGVYDLEDLPARVVLGNEVVDLRKLGACLSLADLCHADASRAPEIVFRHLELEEDSAFHWRRHVQISGITREEDTILMSALTFSEQGEVAVEEYKQAIEQQLEIVRPYFYTLLKPIKRVELEQRRLESPLDQTLQFHANTPEILRILIEGVYDREDVFIRELVQDSLDSCLVRRAKQLRRNIAYDPQILITVYENYATGQPKAIRIDDNGFGMDISDVQDTVLWIGNSISSKSDIVNLLQQTLGKNLIATFGIGLLSCFKISNNIAIRTQKENETPLQFNLTGVSDNINPEKSFDTCVGTTIIVDLLEDKAKSFNFYESIHHYFRQVIQVGIKTLELEWDPNMLSISREDIFKIALTEASSIQPYEYFDEDGYRGFELHGEDFSGAIWISAPDMKSIVKYDGTVDVLNEGVFVTNEPAEDWLPIHMSFCEAIFNFSSGVISLPAGRDRVIRDEKFRSIKQRIIDKSYGLIESFVKQTHNKDAKERDFAAVVLSYMYQAADKDSRDRILKRLDDYRVRRYKREDRLSLSELSAAENVYIQYTQGRFVSDLGEIDGKKLFHKGDDFVELQAAMLAQENQTVISASREDSEDPILEANLIKAYLASTNCTITDLVTTNVLEGKHRSKPVPSVVRQEVGSVVKFVEVTGLPNKKAWKVGNEVWINLANPSMKGIYKELQTFPSEPSKVALVSILFNILSYRFEEAIQDLASLIKEH